MFGILLSRKAYGLAKTAMVAQLAPERTELVTASGHLARTGTIAGGIGTAIGGGLIALVGVEWLPVVGGRRVRVRPRSSPRGFQRPRSSHASRAWSSASRRPSTFGARAPAVATIRAAEGALTFLLALSIKRGGGDEWIFVAALVAAGIGTFLGTMVSPRLHRGFSSDGIVVLTLLIPGAMSAFGVLTIGSLSIVGIALAIGLGGSVAARAMDALYGERSASDARPGDLAQRAAFPTGQRHRSRGDAVLVYPGPRVGFAAVAVVLILGGVTYASQLRLSLRHEAGSLAARSATAWRRPRVCLSRLLAEAMRFAEQGDHYVAIVVADSAVRVVDARSAATPESETQSAWDALADDIGAVVAGTMDPTFDNSMAVIKAAGALIAERSLTRGGGALDVSSG